MNLDEEQKKQVAAWINQGEKLSAIQTRMDKELGLRLTYMEVRLVVDDLKLTPKDPDPPAPTPLLAPVEPPPEQPALDAAAGTVSLTTDQLTRPGAVVSGKVTFSDGQKADWYLDQTGRLGLASQTKGYRPSAPDVQQFQTLLEKEITKLGL